MNLSSGKLIYPRYDQPDFLVESATWTPGIHGVICDNAETAVNNLSSLIINYNNVLGRTLNTYNYDSGKMSYYRADPEPFLFHFDRMYQIEWRYFAEFIGKIAYPSVNVLDELNLDYLKKYHIDNSSYGLVFLTLPVYIRSIDMIGSQIAFDYTYSSGGHGAKNSFKNFEMHRTSNEYYVYDQDSNYFYKFP
ncbi:MAG: hypothetical protein ACOCUI_00630 [bacterium]